MGNILETGGCLIGIDIGKSNTIRKHKNNVSITLQTHIFHVTLSVFYATDMVEVFSIRFLKENLWLLSIEKNLNFYLLLLTQCFRDLD